MPATKSDLSHGQYSDEIEISILGSISTANAVTAYRCEDLTGEEFFIVAPDGIEHKLTPGERYRVMAGLGFDPSFDERQKFAAQFSTVADTECPRCDGILQFNTGLESSPETVDTFFADMGSEGVHLVLTAATEACELSTGDDWQPFQQAPRMPTSGQPAYHCTECHLSIPDGQLEEYLERGEEDWDHGPGPEILNENASVESPAKSIGMATGGAKDVDNFRENIKEGYLPDEDALTYEGIFYDYYFDTGDDRDDTDSLFYPSYSTAVTRHPLTDETEHYLTVGLNSSLTEAEFERRQLNLVAVLDVSGSMSSPFDEYYYDEHGKRQETRGMDPTSKMAAATESLAALTMHLTAQDRFGVVLYNSRAHTAKPLTRVSDTNMEAIRGHIRDVEAGGGTNMSAGLETAIDLLGEYVTADPTAVENRIVFMTDMMPNTGATGQNTIAGTVESAADRGIYTTFIGMGIDANPDLVKSLSSVRGANHYFVHSAAEFKQRLDDEFEYMVTPLVYDLQLELEADTEIEAVYGSPNADTSAGRLMHVATLFPSPTEDGETRGGVILLKLAGKPTGDLDLVASWEEIDGTVESDSVAISFGDDAADSFDNDGIQKAVCLTRYASTLQEWMADVRDRDDEWVPMSDSDSRTRGQWERESSDLVVPEEFSGRFETLQTYIEETACVVGDSELQQEIDLLQTLIEYEPSTVTADLSEEGYERLRDIVRLSPTSNGELAEAWGMDSGPEAYEYLESELSAYYTRNENKYIVPTDRARSLVMNQQ